MQKSPARATCLTILVMYLAGGLVGCGRSGNSTAESVPSNRSGNATASGSNAGGKATPQAGIISGWITRTNGTPVAIPDATITVIITGVSGPGENVSFTPAVAADGTFSIRVPSGIYHPTQASLKLHFDGTLYIYNLIPTTMLNDSQSDAGLVCNFVWQISGPQPALKDMADENNYTNWSGIGCGIDWATTYMDTKGQIHNLDVPDGSKAIFTVTPNGKLIDGTDGKAITLTRSAAGQTALTDLPPATGGWHITGKMTHPDGTTVPFCSKVRRNLPMTTRPLWTK
jgi:hypothetical protein